MSDLKYWINRWPECVAKGWHYDTVKTWTQEQHAEETKFLWKAIEENLSEVKSVLDFGSGKGRFCPFFRKAGMEYVGYEPVGYAKTWAMAYHGDYFVDKWPDRDFDAVVAVTTFQYLSPEEMLSVFLRLDGVRTLVIIESVGEDPAQRKFSHEYPALGTAAGFNVRDYFIRGLELYRVVVCRK